MRTRGSSPSSRPTARRSAGTAVTARTVPALDQLLAEARQSQFFLIGEYHGGVEPPQLTAALFRAFQPLGYRHLAVEMGPLTTARLESLARQPSALDAIRALALRYPFALVFEGWREEAALLVDAVQTAHLPPPCSVVWGLDQEFIFSGRLHFDRLSQLATTPDARAAVAGMRARAFAGETFPRQFSSTPPLLLTATPADFDRLAAAFPREGEATRIIAELRASARVYQEAHAGNAHRASLDRAALMQRHFDDYYAGAVAAGEPLPRVLLKLGDNHLLRGRSFTDVFDLGKGLPTLAARHGLRTYHLLLLAHGGRLNTLHSTSADPRTATVVYHPADTEPGFDPAPLLAAAPADEWTLLDLRPARPLLASGQIKTGDTLARLIRGYDGVLVIPEAHPSTTFR